jgi:hypothetical protein
VYLLALLHLLSVVLFDEKSVGKPDGLFSERRVLLVTWDISRQRFHRDPLPINKMKSNTTPSAISKHRDVHMLGSNASKPLGNRINNLFILRPETRPFKVINIPRRTLRNDKPAQRLNHTPPPHHPPHSRKPRIIPPRNKTLIDKPLQLAFTQHRPHEIETTESNDFDGTHPEGLEHPRVLRVAVLVFERAEGVGDAFDAVDEGAGKVVGWVDFVFCAGAVVGGVVAAVDDWVAEGLVFVVD